MHVIRETTAHKTLEEEGTDNSSPDDVLSLMIFKISSSFTDVKITAWYCECLRWLAGWCGFSFERR
jgi:hypothetical protein